MLYLPLKPKLCLTHIIHLYPQKLAKCFSNISHTLISQRENDTKATSMKTEMGLVPSPEGNLRGAFHVDGFPSATEPIGDLARRAHHDPAVCGDAQDVLLSPH